ncbi:MAG TPA: (S)-ureidoglycine aminohydrolase, partial [Paracoccaceae bacterium]|nr:(S)-ureidoglycine aminohydrolase [Paracoccaceae bacterium]
MTYAFPPGGLPGQDVMPDGKAVFTTAYAFIPANTMR